LKEPLPYCLMVLKSPEVYSLIELSYSLIKPILNISALLKVVFSLLFLILVLGMNSGLHVCKAGALPLELHFQHFKIRSCLMPRWPKPWYSCLCFLM
jgi:hypothetical protein